MESSISGVKNYFSDNDEYLDAVFTYLNGITERTSRKKHKDFDELFGSSSNIDRQWQRILNRLENTPEKLPASEIVSTYKLSTYQYQFLLGLLGITERAVDFEFDDVDDVVKLFVTG